jgi:hypothetical protein
MTLVFVVSHSLSMSKLIEQKIDAVFDSKKDAEEFVDKVQLKVEGLARLNTDIYRIDEVKMLNGYDWNYWKKQIKDVNA